MAGHRQPNPCWVRSVQLLAPLAVSGIGSGLPWFTLAPEVLRRNTLEKIAGAGSNPAGGVGSYTTKYYPFHV